MINKIEKWRSGVENVEQNVKETEDNLRKEMQEAITVPENKIHYNQFSDPTMSSPTNLFFENSKLVLKPSIYTWKEYRIQFTVTVLRNLTPEERLSYNSLVAALNLKFGEDYLIILWFSQLENRLQQPKEDLTAFATNIERSANAAISGKCLIQVMAVRCFTWGMINKEDALNTNLEIQTVPCLFPDSWEP